MKIRYSLPCVYELIPGADKGQILEYCNQCNGENRHVRYCDIHDKCTRQYVSSNVKACVRCNDYVPQKMKEATKRNITLSKPKKSVKIMTHNDKMERRAKVIEELQNSKRRIKESRNQALAEESKNKRYILVEKDKKPEITWEYGITTVEERRYDLLPKTIESLRNAGFDKPKLFIDGTYAIESYRNQFKLDTIVRTERIRTFGNWFLALLEMYIRNPHSSRYVLFQDDIIACKGLREYLEHTVYPDKGYLNLITYPQNEGQKRAQFPGMNGSDIIGWYPSGQNGKGAQGLVFNREAVIDLMTQPYLYTRVQDREKGHSSIDGAIVTALKRLGYTEYVHTPSLIRHTGTVSVMGNHPQPLDLSFKGEDWDCRELIKKDEKQTV